MTFPSASSAVTDLKCSQCGGELHPDEGQTFLTCPYCSATVYVDKSRVVFHWFVAPTLNEQEAIAALYRWMSGSQTVKDLDKKARVTGQAFQYFPLWYFRWKDGNQEQVALQPAAATSVTELTTLRLPAGDLRKYDPSLDSQAAQPNVPLDSALEWVTQRTERTPGALPLPGKITAGQAVQEMAIVHVPLYFYRYEFNGTTFTAVVDAASGTVLANIFPAKREAPYVLVGGVTALVYLCLATFPLFGALADSQSGATVGLIACAGIGLVAAPLLFAWAFWVASKV